MNLLIRTRAGWLAFLLEKNYRLLRIASKAGSG